MKSLYTAPFDQVYLALLEKNFGEVKAGLPEEDRLLDNDEMILMINDVRPDVVIVEVNIINDVVLKHVEGLRIIAVCRSGTNNIDVRAATEKGILVINTPARNAVAVAEWTIALMICNARNFYQGAHLIQNRGWLDMVKTCYDLEGYELAGRKVGIIGIGSIGRAVAQRLRNWEMDILGFDPFVSQTDVDDINVKMTSLEALLTESDFVVLLAAATDENQGMISDEQIGLMKPSAYLINSARASLIDESSLLMALKTGKIAGAALDVHHREPLPFDSPWFELDNVLLTPHLGGATKDTITKHSQMIYEDLLRFKNHERPKNLVNPDVWDRQ
jgi:phosphoglycerate dehydrogenase-like enzyme